MKVSKKVKDNMGKGYLYTMSTVLNEHDNGGESACLSVDVYDNGENLFHNIFLKINSYGTATAEIGLYSIGLAEMKDGIDSLIEQLNKKNVKLVKG